ncbi:hypothetical protein L1987_62694 [Smallanthus sonchifolius]|uniref:Uncharacterized protein n=1 Tax=Smallanthus sonchifolius TaxID=185202 RepID=A0ACB9CB33_9ASTR|nr:hypothetical protein L1987_62694 [Smallanthus sonchifolius]
MGKDNSPLNASRSKKSVIKFGLGNSNKNPPGQTKWYNPKIEEAAHRIIIPIGPNPRKRPRSGSFDSDPFLLDDIINKTGKGAESSGKQKPNMVIPDLNTAMVTTSVGSSENPGDKEEEGRSNSFTNEKPVVSDQEELNREIKATMAVGEKLGINLKEKEDLVRSIIQGEGEIKGLP